MKKIILLFAISFFAAMLHAQNVGIGTSTPDTSAALDISHSSKGLLIPRMTTASMNAIINPASGLMVYDTIINQLMVNMGTPGAVNWQTIASKSSWNLNGNYHTNVVTQFVGTNDNRPLRFRVNGILAGELSPTLGNAFWGLRAGEYNIYGFSNVAIGSGALKLNTNRNNLVAIGDSALFNNGVGASFSDEANANTAIGSKSLFSNTVGSRNTAAGFESLAFNTTGSINTAFGALSLRANTSGRFNTATGFGSLLNNSTGESNTATGNQSLLSNTTGHDNTATGSESLYSNSTGSTNTAMGSQALKGNNTGGDNTAIGSASLRFNSTGNNNTAAGSLSLFYNTTGSNNTAAGVQSLYFNETGDYNTANGVLSLYSNNTGSGNTASGYQSLYSNTTGFGNTANGFFSLYTNTSGFYNTATGSRSLYSNTVGTYNVATGEEALYSNTSGITNTATGYGALHFNTGGNANTAVGNAALRGNTTGTGNTGAGNLALYNTTGSSYNTAVGYHAAFDYNLGWNNTIIGANAAVNFNGIFNSVAVGESALSTASNQVRIGNSVTGSIGGYQNWTSISDGRFKKNIKEDVKGLAFIMKLKPVTYNLDITSLSKKLNESRSKEADEFLLRSISEKEKMIQSGFIAQDVENAAKETGYDFSGVDKPKNANDFYGLRYAEFVVPLVKAVQEQQQQLNEIKKEMGLLKEQNKILQQLLKTKN